MSVRACFPVERETAYTEANLLEYTDYSSNANVNIRYGPGENIIEKAGYDIANLIDGAADVINGWTGKVTAATCPETAVRACKAHVLPGN
ncbi:MAG: hypothetical protein LBK74_06650 [Treponema sp.]|jgi:hypothetical protein|nr:hypothetical protein [Treponema sp.]